MDSELKELLRLFRERQAVSRGAKVSMASGQESDIYVNCKRLTLWGRSLSVLCSCLLTRLARLDPQAGAVAGVSVGGDPLVAGVLLEASRRGWTMEGLLIRKDAKKHGISAGRHVEGCAAESAGRVWVLEDVVSTGRSSLDAVERLRTEGFDVVGVLSIVDRQMGGLEILAQGTGLQAEALLQLSQLSDTAGNR
jgi:orotate phosphoribosyltransferase